MKHCLVLVAGAILLTGCMDNGHHGYPRDVRVQGYGYSVDVGDGYHPPAARGKGNGGCPPGHAKKGWC
jgi:predicted small secreted protein